ncbi:MAG: enoyl-CoA hydratase/isomerase family protein [Pseudomonadota bacterium]
MTTLMSCARDGALAVLTLNNPPHNLITGAFIEQYCAALESAAEDGARAILIKSDLRHFCAGADVGALTSDAIDAAKTLKRLESIPVPTVAALNGAVLGGGFELALACDFIVAAESAEIGSVEVHIGLAPLLGAVQRLVRLAGPARAREITMLGRRYDPRVLEQWGIINLVVTEHELASASLSLARQLAAGPTMAIAGIKELVNVACNDGVEAADAAQTQTLQAMWQSKDLKRGVQAMKSSGPGTAVFEGD